MKLPEHYEQWVQTSFSSTPFGESCKSGARAMYRKLMEDFAPAIEALELLDAECIDADLHEELGESCDICHAQTLRDQALAALKEKGLVE